MTKRDRKQLEAFLNSAATEQQRELRREFVEGLPKMLAAVERTRAVMNAAGREPTTLMEAWRSSTPTQRMEFLAWTMEGAGQ